MQAVILAAGKGSRLHPLTLTRSKAMIPILGKPMVERVLETLVENGVRDVIMVVSPEDREIRRHFEENGRLGVTIRFVEQAERLGMANALSIAAPLIREPFVMSACDNLTPPQHVADLIATHHGTGAKATLSLMEIDRSLAGRTGVVEWRNGRIWRIVEKPKPEEAPSNISSLPLYVFDPQILELLPDVQLSARGEYELQDAIQMLIQQTGCVMGAFTTNRLQLTNAADLLALNQHYLETGGDAPQLAPQEVGRDTHLITPLRIEEGVTIGQSCMIGPRVYIERNCRIGSHVTIRDAVILRDTVIDDGRTIAGEVAA